MRIPCENQGILVVQRTMQTTSKNIIVLALTVIAALPAIAFIFSAPTMAPPAREGSVAVGKIEFSVPSTPKPTVTAAPVAVTRKAPKTVEDPRIEQRAPRYNPTLIVRTAPNASPLATRERGKITLTFEAPGNLPL